MGFWCSSCYCSEAYKGQCQSNWKDQKNLWTLMSCGDIRCRSACSEFIHLKTTLKSHQSCKFCDMERNMCIVVYIQVLFPFVVKIQLVIVTPGGRGLIECNCIHSCWATLVVVGRWFMPTLLNVEIWFLNLF